MFLAHFIEENVDEQNKVLAKKDYENYSEYSAFIIYSFTL